MNESARYAKIVEWSEEDQCFVGSSPGLIYGGCHGQDEKAVFEQLCQVVEEAIALYHQDGPDQPGRIDRYCREFDTTEVEQRQLGHQAHAQPVADEPGKRSQLLDFELARGVRQVAQNRLEVLAYAR